MEDRAENKYFSEGNSERKKPESAVNTLSQSCGSLEVQLLHHSQIRQRFQEIIGSKGLLIKSASSVCF